MKIKNSLTASEREIVNKFVKMKYPAVYKTDKTDRILFVELVDFDVCPYLLGENRINKEQYNYILSEYERFLMQTDNSMSNGYEKDHYLCIIKLMELFKKYYSMN